MIQTPVFDWEFDMEAGKKKWWGLSFVIFLGSGPDRDRLGWLAGWTSGLAGWASGMAGWASGLAGWASGLAGWPRGGDKQTDKWTDGRMDGRKISPFYRTSSPIEAAAQ